VFEAHLMKGYKWGVDVFLGGMISLKRTDAQEA
jgi:hypothetical protein